MMNKVAIVLLLSLSAFQCIAETTSSNNNNNLRTREYSSSHQRRELNGFTSFWYNVLNALNPGCHHNSDGTESGHCLHPPHPPSHHSSSSSSGGSSSGGSSGGGGSDDDNGGGGGGGDDDNAAGDAKSGCGNDCDECAADDADDGCVCACDDDNAQAVDESSGGCGNDCEECAADDAAEDCMCACDDDMVWGDDGHTDDNAVDDAATNDAVAWDDDGHTYQTSSQYATVNQKSNSAKGIFAAMMVCIAGAAGYLVGKKRKQAAEAEEADAGVPQDVYVEAGVITTDSASVAVDDAVVEETEAPNTAAYEEPPTVEMTETSTVKTGVSRASTIKNALARGGMSIKKRTKSFRRGTADNENTTGDYQAPDNFDSDSIASNEGGVVM